MMNTQDIDDQEDKQLPGTLLESNESVQTHSHEHISHQHRYSLSHSIPALVEVGLNLM